MQKDAVGVEANLLAKRARMRNERRVTIKEEPSTSDVKIDTLAKSLEKLVDRLEIMERKPQWDNQQQGPQIRNPNFRKNPNTGKPREGPPDQQIRPPFQENYAESSHQNEEDQDTQINLMGINDGNTIFLTQEEHELCMLQQLQFQFGESFDHKKGYEFSTNEVHKKYTLGVGKTKNPLLIKLSKLKPRKRWGLLQPKCCKFSLENPKKLSLQRLQLVQKL